MLVKFSLCELMQLISKVHGNLSTIVKCKEVPHDNGNVNDVLNAQLPFCGHFSTGASFRVLKF